MKPIILFVDDEPNILDGFRTLLRRHRKVWDMRFALSGAEALEMLEQEPATVVVSDMRMPGMDGVELLAAIHDRWPGTLRVILSGYSDSEAILLVAAYAHHFLAKPCSPEKLVEVLERILRLSDLLTNEAVRTRISGLESIPTLPKVYMEVVRELDRPEPSIERLGTIVQADPGISATLLKLVNSAFFGFYGNVSNPTRAVTLLGTETLRGLVLSASLLQKFHKVPTNLFDIEVIGEHSRRTGLLAKTIAAQHSRDRELLEHCFLAGFLHDLGRLVMAHELYDQYEPVVRKLREEGGVLVEMEQTALGVTHAEVGAYLLGVWGMSEDMVIAVRAHHDLRLDPGEGLTPALGGHSANIIDHELRGWPEANRAALDEEVLAARGFAGQTAKWREVCREALDNA
jgi:HD-like signal output (HDOD) protein/CheY-like chemotaxis protein